MFKNIIYNLCVSWEIYNPHMILTYLLLPLCCSWVCAENKDMKHFGITVYKVD